MGENKIIYFMQLQVIISRVLPQLSNAHTLCNTHGAILNGFCLALGAVLVILHYIIKVRILIHIYTVTCILITPTTAATHTAIHTLFGMHMVLF